jgi:ribonuclease R
MTAKKPVTEDSASLRRIVLEIFREHEYAAYNHKQVAKKLRQEPFFTTAEALIERFSDQQLKEALIATLEHLAQEEELQETDRGKYKLWPQSRLVEGRIDIASNGNAYVMNEDFEEDIFIDRYNLLNALNGDLVKVNLFAVRPGKRPQGEVIEIIERARTEFVGTIQVSRGFAFLSSGHMRNGVDLFIPLDALNGGKHGEKAVARITHWPEDAANPQGEIVRVLGMPGDNDVEMDAILVEYGFPLSFPEDVEAEAEAVPYRIPRKEIDKRRDFRPITTFTIDPVDAKDFDDALSVRFLENGHLEVGIHIADVSHYVQPGSAMDDEAFDRATSVYLVDRVIPMLPEKLSNLVCSLRPGEDKLCFSAVFELDQHGQVLNEWFGRTIIHSDRRFTYEEAQEVIERGEGDLCEEVLTLHRIAQKLRSKRFADGAITFDRVEVRFRLDERAHPVDVYLKENKDSNKLIEEFMLLANRRVAESIGRKLSVEKNREFPFVYRVHDTPVSDKLESFALFAGRFGHKVNTRNEKDLAHSLNKLMRDIKGKREQNVLEQLAIRTMAKAIYTTDNIGHYGLAFDYYTHFTSPIRRYPDVVVHRLLAHYLEGGAPADADEIEDACEHSTQMEIKASEAERASVKFKQVQYLLDRKDEVFTGMISGVTEWGLYVEIPENKCEGLVRVRDLTDDFYSLNEEEYSLVGHRTHKTYRLGDMVRVRLKSADLVKKQIDFLLEEMPLVSRKTATAQRSKGGFRGKPGGRRR